MAASNQTPNYGLPQYVGGDTFKSLTTFNQAMASIDAGMKAAQDKADAAVPQTNTIAGLPMNAPITLAQLIAVGLCPAPESGTWTPTLYGATTAGSPAYSYRIGTYVKINKKVTCNILLKLTAVGGAAGYVCIGGLPFTTQNSGINTASNKLSLSYIALSSGNIAGCIYLPSHANFFMFYKESTAGTGISGEIYASEITDTFGIYGTFTYISQS